MQILYSVLVSKSDPLVLYRSLKATQILRFTIRKLGAGPVKVDCKES